MSRLWHRMLFNSLSLEDYNLSLYGGQCQCLANKASTGNQDASADLFFSNIDELDSLQLDGMSRKASELLGSYPEASRVAPL